MPNLDARNVICIIDNGDVDLLTLGDHFVIEIPTCASSEFRNNDVAVTEEIDVEVDVMDRL